MTELGIEPAIDSPFVGLRPYRSTESLLFFGRRQQVIELLERLHRARFVPVVGSSGSGKSSLIRAGLIPKLEAGFLVEDRDRWILAIMNPGESPLENLAGAVLNATGTTVDSRSVGELLEEISSSGASAIVEKLAPVLEQADANFFLLVDQFEELFRFALRDGRAEQKDKASDFVSILLSLAEQRTAPIYIVTTMRSDFLGDCDAFHGLPEATNRSQYLVPRPTRQQRREAIDGPVRLYGQMITPQLLDRVLNDAGDESDQLPVMQHALLRTWENWRESGGDGPVDLPNYLAIGSMKAALSRDADEALQGMNAEELELTKCMFQALTETDAANRPIRRPVRVSDLQAITGASRDNVMEIVERFRGHGRSFLVVRETVGGEALIDICHESLIRQWATLREWVDCEVKSGKLYRRVAESAARHAAGEEDTWRDPQLQLALDERRLSGWNEAWAERYGGRFNEASAFLDLSRKQRDQELREKEKQQRRMRRLTAAFLGLSVLLLIIPAYLLYYAAAARRSALATRQEALAAAAAASQKERNAEELMREAVANALYAQAQTADESDRITDAAMEVAEKRRAEAELTNQKLVGLRLGNQALNEFANDPFGRVARDRLVRSGMLAIESLRRHPTFEGRSALFQVLRLLPEPPEILPAHERPVRALAYSSDGRWMASVGEEGTVLLWDVANKMSKTVLETDLTTAPSASGLAFSPDGRWLAAGGMNTLAIWDVTSHKPAQRLDGSVPGFVRSLSFSPDGTKLAAAGQFGARGFRWISDHWEQAETYPADEKVLINAAAFLIQHTVAFAGNVSKADQQFGLWTGIWTSNEAIGLPSSEGHSCDSLTESADKLALAAVCSDVGLLVMRVGPASLDGKELQMAAGPYSISPGIALDGHGNQLAAMDNDGAISVYETWPARASGVLAEPKRVLLRLSASVAFRPDGRAVAGGLPSGSIALWSTTRGAEAFQFPSSANGLAFVSDDRLLAFGSDGAVRVFDVANADSIRQIGSFQVDPDSKKPVVSPDGRLLAIFTRADASGVRVIRSRDWKTIAQLKFENATQEATFTPDNRRLLISDWHSIRRLVVSEAGIKEESPILPGDKGFFDRGPLLSPDGQSLATHESVFCSDSRGGHCRVGTESVWNLAKGSKVAWNRAVTGSSSTDRPSQGGSQPLIAESRDWRELARDWIVSADGEWSTLPDGPGSTIELSEQGSDRVVARLEHDGDVLDAAFSLKSRWLATASADGLIRLWPLQANDMIERACKLLPRNLTQKEWADLKLDGKYQKICPNLPIE
jgi:WD40 repeat protein